MIEPTWYDYLRVVNAILALVCLWRLGISFNKDRKTYSPRLRDFWWVLSATFLTAIVGSVEQIIGRADWGSRTILTTAVVLVGLRATRHSDEPLQHK